MTKKTLSKLYDLGAGNGSYSEFENFITERINPDGYLSPHIYDAFRMAKNKKHFIQLIEKFESNYENKNG